MWSLNYLFLLAGAITTIKGQGTVRCIVLPCVCACYPRKVIPSMWSVYVYREGLFFSFFPPYFNHKPPQQMVSTRHQLGALALMQTRLQTRQPAGVLQTCSSIHLRKRSIQRAMLVPSLRLASIDQTGAFTVRSIIGGVKVERETIDF